MKKKLFSILRKLCSFRVVSKYSFYKNDMCMFFFFNMFTQEGQPPQRSGGRLVGGCVPPSATSRVVGELLIL
jgi:hypothetical protein